MAEACISAVAMERFGKMVDKFVPTAALLGAKGVDFIWDLEVQDTGSVHKFGLEVFE